MISRWPLVDPEFDRLHHLVGLGIDYGDDRAVLARDVDEAVRADLERMRRDVGTKVDGGGMRALVQVEHANEMLRVGIAAMNPIAEDRHIGEAGFRHHQQLVHGARKSVDHQFGLVRGGIEKQHFAAHLVDRDHTA